jgi:hypothetical protein
MKFCRKKIKDLLIRWITISAVLFYVLVPEIGVCNCSCCNHFLDNNRDSLASCCSQKKSHTTTDAENTENSESKLHNESAIGSSCCANFNLDDKKNCNGEAEVGDCLRERGCCNTNADDDADKDQCPCQSNFSFSSWIPSICSYRVPDKILVELKFSFSAPAVSLYTNFFGDIAFVNGLFEAPVLIHHVRLHLLFLVLLQ